MLGFKRPSTLRRLHDRLAGPSLQGFADALAAEGYPAKTSAGYLSAAAHLTEWAAAPPRAAQLPVGRHLVGCCGRSGESHGEAAARHRRPEPLPSGRLPGAGPILR
jgi:hypothetical protein